MQRILIIDDIQAWNKLLGWHLTACGFKVDSAASCEEGLEKWRKSRPDCVLMDFDLKDGTAVSMCAAMRLESDRPLPPVIIVSANPCAEGMAYTECLAQKFVLKDKDTFNSLPAAISEVIQKEENK